MIDRQTERGAHKMAKAIVVSKCPDVCKTPLGNSVVPVPYSLFANFADAVNTAVDVNFEGTLCFHSGSHLPTVTGNEAGTKGGVKSGVNVGICNPKDMSNSVRINGKWAIRNVDEMHMNAAQPVPPGSSRNVERLENGKLCYQCRKKLAELAAGSDDPEVKAAGEALNRELVDVEYAKLSVHSYHDDRNPPDGWSEISLDSEALAKYNIDEDDLRKTGSNYKAKVYEPDPSYFGKDLKPSVVFEGTDLLNPEDWKNNIRQGLGMHSSYYNHAVLIGDSIKAVGADVHFAGHSLGGGLATAAASASGLGASVFNSAGLHAKTVEKYGGILHDPPVNAYRTVGDIVTHVHENLFSGILASIAIGGLIGGGLQGVAAGALIKLVTGVVLPDAIGDLNVALKNLGGLLKQNPLSAHSSDGVVKSLEAQIAENQEILEKEFDHACETCH